MMWSGGMAVWGLLWAVLLVALFLLTVLGVVWIVQKMSASPGRPDVAYEDLARRYALGQVDREKFLRRR